MEADMDFLWLGIALLFFSVSWWLPNGLDHLRGEE
jgi:hypothetical protein